MRQTILHPDGNVVTTEVAHQLSLKPLQTIVGGLIQSVPDFKRYDGRRVNAAWCDEEGLIKGKPLNEAATAAWRDYLDGTELPYSREMATLYGTVVIYTRD